MVIVALGEIVARSVKLEGVTSVVPGFVTVGVEPGSLQVPARKEERRGVCVSTVFNYLWAVTQEGAGGVSQRRDVSVHRMFTWEHVFLGLSHLFLSRLMR